jgi:hypothetical protein
VSSKHEELESLYASVNHVVTEGLTNFEKATALNLPQLQCTLLILKAACNNDPTYIDRFLSLSLCLSLSLFLSFSLSLSISLSPSFPLYMWYMCMTFILTTCMYMYCTCRSKYFVLKIFHVQKFYCFRMLPIFLKVVQKLHKEHLSASPAPDVQTAPLISDLLQLGLDMCKMRISLMPQESRKAFISIMTNLIEKSSDAKLLRVITKIVEEWVKSKVCTMYMYMYMYVHVHCHICFIYTTMIVHACTCTCMYTCMDVCVVIVTEVQCIIYMYNVHV